MCADKVHKAKYGLIAEPLRAAHKILQELNDELQNELIYVFKTNRPNESKRIRTEIYSQVERRILVRSIFSYIEAITFAMKALVLSDPDSSKLTEGERMLASEVTYELGPAGEASIRSAKIPLTNNIRFTFKIFSKVFGSWSSLDTSGKDWACLQRSIKVRNRITHPKQSTDLVVTDTEVVEVIHALNWFNRSNTRATIEWYAAQTEKHRILEEALTKLTKMKGWNKRIPADLQSHIAKLLERQIEVPEELQSIASKLIKEREEASDATAAAPENFRDL